MKDENLKALKNFEEASQKNKQEYDNKITGLRGEMNNSISNINQKITAVSIEIILIYNLEQKTKNKN